MPVSLVAVNAVKLNTVAICKANYAQVATIYAEGLATGVATFETTVPDWPTWHAKYLPFARMAAVNANTNHMLGWAALAPTSARWVYRGVAEASLYVAQAARGQGVGRYLLGQLITQSEANGVWSLQSSVFPENKASISLQQAFGFRVIGYKELIAQRNGQWHDNVLLERRSKVVAYPA